MKTQVYQNTQYKQKNWSTSGKLRLVNVFGHRTAATMIDTSLLDLVVDP